MVQYKSIVMDTADVQWAQGGERFVCLDRALPVVNYRLK